MLWAGFACGGTPKACRLHQPVSVFGRSSAISAAVTGCRSVAFYIGLPIETLQPAIGSAIPHHSKVRHSLGHGACRGMESEHDLECDQSKKSDQWDLFMPTNIGTTADPRIEHPWSYDPPSSSTSGGSDLPADPLSRVASRPSLLTN